MCHGGNDGVNGRFWQVQVAEEWFTLAGEAVGVNHSVAGETTFSPRSRLVHSGRMNQSSLCRSAVNR